MTVNQLIEALEALSPEDRELPVYTYPLDEEVYDIEVQGGVQKNLGCYLPKRVTLQAS